MRYGTIGGVVARGIAPPFSLRRQKIREAQVLYSSCASRIRRA